MQWLAIACISFDKNIDLYNIKLITLLHILPTNMYEKSMKHFNTGALSMLIALLGTTLCHAAAGEPIKYTDNVVGYRFKENISYTLVQLEPKAPYECSELTEEEAKEWFPPRPEVVTYAHYDDWDSHVDNFFGGPFQAKAKCDTDNAQEMMKRDYDWFVKFDSERKADNPWECMVVPVSLEQNLIVADNRLSMQDPNLGQGLEAQRKELTKRRVAKIELYRIGLFAEIKGRERCPTIGCQFIKVETHSGLPYILVNAEPVEAWEKLDVLEQRHVIPEPLGDDPAGEFYDAYIKNPQKALTDDYVNADHVLNRYIDIFYRSNVTVGVVAVPVVVTALQRLLTKRKSRLLVLGITDFVREGIVQNLANLRMKKDMDFFNTLCELQNARGAVPVQAIVQIPTVENIAPTTKTTNRLPRVGGFFAGLGWAGSVWFAIYLLRTCQDGVRIASGCASAAAGMAFMFARHKLANEGINHKFWRGVRDGAGVGAVLGGGLFAAHDTPAVQKLFAMAARNN
jgi:hypothetical protein